MNLEEIFKDKSESTKKNYIQRINRLKKLYFPDDNDYVFIKKPNRLIKKINGSDYPASTKRDFYISLYAVDPIEKYKNEMYKFRDETNKKQGESTISEEKLKNYDTMKNLRKILDIMPENTYIEVRDKLLVSIYLLKPPIRNDLESVAIFEKNKVLDPNIKDTLNYIQKKDKEFIFYLNQYKTVKKYGAKKIIYSKSQDPEIYNLFKKIMKFNKPFLIVNDTNNPLDDKQISALIIKIFENYLNKHVSINTIRHIYETELINSEEYKKMSMTQKKAKHDELMHDFTTAHTDYNKINMPQEEEQIPLIPMKPQKMYRAKLIKLEEVKPNLKPEKKIIKKINNAIEEIKPKEPTIKYDVNKIVEELNKNKPVEVEKIPLMIKYINFDDLTLPELKQLAIDYNNKFIIKITKTENEKQVLKNKAELLKDVKYFLKVDDNNKIVSKCLDLELKLTVNESKNINEDIKALKKLIKTLEKNLVLNPDDKERQNILIQQKEQLVMLENKVEEKPPKKVKVINLKDEKPKKKNDEKVEKVDKSQNIEIEKDIKDLKEAIKNNEKAFKLEPEKTYLLDYIKQFKIAIENLKKQLI